MNNYTVIFKTENKEVIVPAGTTIHNAAEQAGVILDTVCGGEGTCGKCVVKVFPDDRDVLACKYTINKDITVAVPFAERHFEQRKIADHLDLNIKPDPSVSKVYLARPDQLTKVLENKFPEFQISIPDPVSDQLASMSFENGITVVFRKTTSPQVKQTIEVLSLEPSDTTSSLCGVAVDIGTTTVVLKLFNLNDASLIAVAAAANPQISRGDDVISRINYASTDKGLKDLHDVIIKCLNTLIDKVCKDAKIESASIYEACIAGNTTMNHLFLQLPVKQLGEAPYKAYSLDACDINAADTGMKINPAANVHTIENIASFIGSDTMAAALAVSMDSVEKMTLVK